MYEPTEDLVHDLAPRPDERPGGCGFQTRRSFLYFVKQRFVNIVLKPSHVLTLYSGSVPHRMRILPKQNPIYDITKHSKTRSG